LADRVQELEAGIANMRRQQEQLLRHVKSANEQTSKLEVQCYTFYTSVSSANFQFHYIFNSLH